jgi:hypothetical protein
MELQFNNEGVPLLGFGTKIFMATKGGPNERPDVSKQMITLEDKTPAGKYTVAEWGAANNFPGTANDLIRSVSVLNTGLKFLRNLTLGQGIFPCHVEGYDDEGNEILKIATDKELIHFCDSRLVRRYLEKLLRDYLKFGVGNVQLIPNEEGNKMVGLNTLNSMYCRYTEAKDGIIEKVIVSGKWPDNPSDKEFEAITLLDEYDPLTDLERYKYENAIKGNSFAVAVRDSWSNNDYYSEPLWWSAWRAGWVGIAQEVPKFISKAMKNQISWKWHTKIPYAFWDKKFPKETFKNYKERSAAIEDFMNKLEDNLTGAENADKPIFSFYEINPQSGRAEEKWEIEALDNKSKDADKLFTSAAANSEILFSLMINPNVLGAGMPGGTYAGNQGGSNIREAFLVNIANAWIDRHNLLDPLEIFLEFNGKKDIQLRFRNTILTTLDTGAGTTKRLS